MCHSPELVQIFIPTFNRCALLQRAIESALSQTHRAVQIVVLDNNSTDDTALAMDSLARRHCNVRYIRHPRNLGMIANFNMIGPLVTAPFFCVLTDDDTYEGHFLETTIGLFRAFPGAGIAASNAPIRKNDQIVRTLTEHWQEGLQSQGTRVSDCNRSRHPMFTHCVFRKTIAQEFVFHDDVAMMSDGVLLTCLATKYDIAYSHTVTGYWDIHGSNATELQTHSYTSGVTTAAARFAIYDGYCKAQGLRNRLRQQHRISLGLALLREDGSAADFSLHLARADVRRALSFFGLSVVWVARTLRLLRPVCATYRVIRCLRPSP